MLTPENVHDTFVKCLFEESEDTSNHKAVIGVNLHIGFNPERLKENEQLIVNLLNELPDTFKDSKGGGMSFLGMCQDKNGELWTGSHQIVDELLCLGLAIDKVKFTLPKELSGVLPGGVPYITIL